MKREYLITIFFIVFILSVKAGFSQTSISGVVNVYSAVDSIYPTKDTVEVIDPGIFSANDTVMIYQAKGANPRTIVSPQPYNFGQVTSLDVNEAGNYEIILVQEVVDDTVVIFKSLLNDDYDTDGLVQLVKVPSYKNVSVDADLTCDAWDGEKGGIVALMVSDTLFLNANIDVTGKGFRGAAPLQSNGDCAESDSALYASQYFNLNTPSISAGRKGEGIAKYDTTYAKGLGRWANAGGGGNARFSGGGGGGNDGNGGYGGEQDTTTCLNTPAYETSADYGNNWNALGGSDGYGLGVQGLVNDSTIFMGGSGGSGTYTTGLLATSGGNGGGIILIMAKVIKSNGDYSIIANGESVVDVAQASAGGGGAAGTIVFDVDSVISLTSELIVSLNGGNGGNVQTHGTAGSGGGGAGGPLLWNHSQPNINFDLDKNGGRAGYAQNLYPAEEYHKAKPGQPGGTIKPNVKVPLTGFLFNSVTSNQQICKNTIPDLVSGSEPRGGNGTFTYQWQYKKDIGDAWVDTAVTTRDLQPVSLNDTTYYRRVVTSGAIVDNGNFVEIIVLDNIVNNQIFGDDLITCIGNEADTITGTKAIVSGGDYSEYNYMWQYKLDNGDWNTDNALNDTTYLHGTVQDTTLVRRIVQSGACYDTTANIQIIGLPQISNNKLSEDQEICYSQIPNEIVGEVHEGGLGIGTDSTYWEQKTESSVWTVVADSSRKDLAPSNLIETTYYRRIILSDDCMSISDTVKINVLPLITKDSITTSTLIYTCYGTAPEQILGSEPEGGAGTGTYSYQWQQSADGNSWLDISTNATDKDYQPEALTDVTYFRRLVSSGQDGCCTSISDTVQVNIYSLPVATIKDRVDTICSGDTIILNMSVSQGKLPYIITYRDGYNKFTSNPISDTQYNPIVTPETTSQNKIYDYTIATVTDDNGCDAVDTTGLTKINVYGYPTANAGLDDENCNLSYQLAATPSYGTGIWTQVGSSGHTSFDDSTSATSNLTVRNADTYKYEWKETNWKCPDVDTVEIILYERPFNIFVNPQDTTLYFIDEVNLKGGYINPDQFETTSLWEMISGNGNFAPSVDDSLVSISNLNDLGQEQISVTWTVSKRECEDSVVNVSIKLKELFNPTGFTPNGDGVNDYLKFNGIENSDQYTLIIFNRWGTEVYRETEEKEVKGWDGKHKGKDLPEDTYYYILNVTDDNVTQTHKGFIVLKRY